MAKAGKTKPTRGTKIEGKKAAVIFFLKKYLFCCYNYSIKKFLY